MSFGFQINDENGNVFIDSSDRLSRYISSHYVHVYADFWVNVTVPGMVNDGTWFVLKDRGIAVVVVGNGYFSAKLGANAAGGDSYQNFLVGRA